MKTRRESRCEPPPYQETYLESSLLLPGSDEWARRRQLDRRAKFFGAVLSVAFLFSIAIFVVAVFYTIKILSGEEDGSHMGNGLGRRFAEIVVGSRGWQLEGFGIWRLADFQSRRTWIKYESVNGSHIVEQVDYVSRGIQKIGIPFEGFEVEMGKESWPLRLGTSIWESFPIMDGGPHDTRDQRHAVCLNTHDLIVMNRDWKRLLSGEHHTLLLYNHDFSLMFIRMNDYLIQNFLWVGGLCMCAQERYLSCIGAIDKTNAEGSSQKVLTPAN